MSEIGPAIVADDQRAPVDPSWRRAGRMMLRRAVDAGLAGTRLRAHVVICGFPRSGSTLLQLMIRACTEEVHGFTTEVEGMWAASQAPRRDPWMLTKRPADIENVGTLRAWYDAHPGRVHFVLTERDPRGVLTSRHSAYPPHHGYYVSVQRWRRVHQLLEPLRHDDDVTVVRYEALVTRPNEVQRTLESSLGWRSSASFADAHQRVDADELDRMTRGALGGLRSPDCSRTASWCDPGHRDRLRDVVDQLPDLPALLVRDGYAADESWLTSL